ncbi:MAG: PAS domain S-box protein, partial [Anaerolineales bacterium]|nr:PAS domain S-box protein [Anaerolineales bacterium]
MKKILDDALQSLGASKGFIMLLSKDGAQKKVSGTPDLILSESLAASEDIELTLMDNPDYILNLKRLRQVVYSNNPSESEWNWSFPPGDYNPKNILIAPILIEDDTVGSIVLIDKKDGFLETDSRIACMIADFSAKTIQQELEMDRLEKSETKYRSLVEQSSNGMALVDGRGIIIEWNQGAEVITGYRPEQICGREAWEVQHAVCTNPPTTSAVFKDLFYRFVDSFNKDDYKAKTTSFQARIKHQDGSIRHVYCTLFPIYTNGEFLTGCIFADETEQIEAEEALFESENRYRTIFETTGTATIIIEEDMTISLANAGFEKLTGKSTNDTENKIQFIEFIIPEEKERLKNYHNIRRINPNLAPPTYETQIMDVEKNVQDVIINVSVIPKTKRTVGSILNITNRKRLERENEERQVYLENLLACAPDAIITLDNHLKIQEWNQGAENLFGYKRDEVKGQNLDRFINRSNVVDKLVALANMNNTCTALPSMETVLYRKDGTPVDVIFAGAPIIVREALVGLVCIFTNISGLKKSAQSLEREAQVNSTMAKVAQKLLTPAYLPELSSMVIKSAIELTGSNTGFTGFIDPENANLIISTITEGQSQDGIKTRQLVFDKETGMWRWTLKHRQPLLSNDPSSIPHGTMFPLGHTPLVRFITAPAFVENTLLGQIAVANSKEDYTQQDLDVIKQLAALYALAIYRHQSERAVATLNTTLEQRVEARTAEMQILYELTQKIGFVRNYEELFSLVLEHLYKVVRYDVAGLVLVDDRSVNYQIKIAKSSTSKLQEEIKANLLSSFRSLSGNEEISDEKSALRIEWIENTTTLPAMDYIENIFKAPLMVGGRIQGMILVGNHDAEAFDADQRRFIATLVHQAGDSVQRLQSLLTQERIRLERLVEHLPEGVLMLDANRRLLIANPTGRSYLKILNDIQIGGVLESLGKTLLDDMLAPDSGETMSEIEFNEMVFEVTGRP